MTTCSEVAFGPWAVIGRYYLDYQQKPERCWWQHLVHTYRLYTCRYLFIEMKERMKFTSWPITNPDICWAAVCPPVRTCTPGSFHSITACLTSASLLHSLSRIILIEYVSVLDSVLHFVWTLLEGAWLLQAPSASLWFHLWQSRILFIQNPQIYLVFKEPN